MESFLNVNFLTMSYEITVMHEFGIQNTTSMFQTSDL